MLGILVNRPTWEICPKKKKKNPGINQCGEKGGGGVLHIRRKRAEQKKNPGINQCGEKGRGGIT